MSYRASVWVATAALLAALAVVLDLLRVKINYPLLPFLTFNLSEIPVVLAFLLMGFKAGMVVAFAQWFALNLGVPFQPGVGPLMKLLAVTSMLVGLYVGGRFWRRGEPLRGRHVALMTVLGALVRVSAMALATFLLYYIIFPERYLSFAGKVLGNVLGLQVESALLLTLIMVALTSLFNLLHTPLSVIPAAAIYKAYVKATGRQPALEEQRHRA